MHCPRVRGTSALAALVLLASACTGSHSTTTHTASQATSAGTVKSGLADVLVQLNCEAKPAQVQRLLGNADATLTTEPPGTKCIWGAAPNADTRIELVATRSMSYLARKATWPGPFTDIDVPGATAATVFDDPAQKTADGKVEFCVVVTEVDARALEVVGFGFSEKGCVRMVGVAAELLKGQAPPSSTLPQTPVKVQR